jgi:protein kinase-like protein
MLSRDGEVKLVDFGIAVTLGAADVGDDVQSAPTGSFPYMSPEQVRREPLSGTSDLFSVGVLLWEMLVGRRLFARNDPDATLAAVTEADIPRPSSVRPDVPAKLDEVVMRALERDVTARWSSAADMLAALQRYLYSLDETPGPRDIDALVARYCPPETRRVPTHADVGHDDPQTPPAAPAGPRTAVIPERAAARGKRARTETFATNVDLEKILERATPLFPIQAIRDEDVPPPTNGAPRGDATPVRARQPERDDPTSPRASTNRMARIDDVGGSSTRMERVSDEAPLRDPRTGPSNRGLFFIAAVGAVILGLAAIYVFQHGKSAVMRADAGPKYDAPPWVVYDDAPAVDATPASIDAEVIDALEPPIDAKKVEASHDAHVVVAPKADAGSATIKPEGTGTLVIGAVPWADVVIDGVAGKRTPLEQSVSAGKHTIELIYRGDDPPKTKTFTITVKDGERAPVQWDFTKS